MRKEDPALEAGRLRELLALSADWFWEQDGHFRFVWYSDGAPERIGRSLASLIGKTRWEVARADPDDPHWRAHRETLERHEPFRDFEAPYPADDATVRWVNVSGVPIFDRAGRFRGYSGVGRDVTQLKRAERALAQSEARFRDFARANGDFFAEIDADGRYTWVSESVGARRRGVPPEWYVGRRRVEVIAPRADLAREPWKSHLEALERHEPFRDFRYVTAGPDGGAVISVNGVPFFDEAGRFLGYRNSSTDITERIRSEQRAREADERLRAAIEHFSEAVALCDADDRFILVNRWFAELNAPVAESITPGRRFEEFLRAAVTHGLFPDAVGNEEGWLERRMAARRAPTGPYEVRRQDGIWLMVTEQRLPDGGTLFVGVNITQRKQAELALAQSEARFRDFTLASGDMLSEQDAEGRYTWVSDSIAAARGVSPGWYIGKNRLDLAAPGSRFHSGAVEVAPREAGAARAVSQFPLPEKGSRRRGLDQRERHAVF